MLTWESLDTSLGIAQASADVVDAGDVGLFAFRGAGAALDVLEASIALRSEPRDQPLTFTLHEIVWDGTVFHVEVVPGEIAG